MRANRHLRSESPFDEYPQTTTPSFARFERHPSNRRQLGPTFEEWTSRHIPNSNFLEPYTTVGPSLRVSTSIPEYNEEYSSNTPRYSNDFSTNAPEYRDEFSSNAPDWYSTTAPTSTPDTDFRINSASPYYEQGSVEQPSARQTRTRFPSFFSDSPFHTAGSTFYSSWPDPEAAFLAQYSTTPEPVRTEDALEYTNTAIPDYASTSSRGPVSEPTTPELNLLSSTLSVDVKDTASPDISTILSTPDSQYTVSSPGVEIPKNWILIAKDPEMLQSFLKSSAEYSTNQAPTSQEPAITTTYASTESITSTSSSYEIDATPEIVTAAPSKVDDLQQLVASSAQGLNPGSFNPSTQVSDQSFLPFGVATGSYALIQNNQPTQQVGTQQVLADFAPSSFVQNYPGSVQGLTSTIRTPVLSYNAPIKSTYNTPQPIRTSYGAPSQTYGAPSQSYGAPSQSYGAPSQSYGAPSQSYGTPSQSYGAPSQSYGAPSQSYGAPSQSYGAPSQTYGAPIQTSYGAPTKGYGAPKPTKGYGAPKAAKGYGAPKASKGYGVPSPTAGYSTPRPAKGYGAPGHAITKIIKDYITPKPNKGYGITKLIKGYGAHKANKGYGAPKPTKGYGAPKPTKGYGAPKATKGYGAPKAAKGYGAPKPTKGYGAPKPSKGYGAPGLAQGYSTPTSSYSVSSPATTFFRPQNPVEHFRITPVSQGAPIKLQLVGSSSPVHAILGNSQSLPPSTQKPVWNQPYNEPVQRLQAQTFNYGSTTRFDYDIGPTTSAPSEPFRSSEAVSFTSDSIPFRPSNLMTVSSTSSDVPLPGEYRQGRSQNTEVVREYPVPRADSISVDHMSFVVQPNFPYTS